MRDVALPAAMTLMMAGLLLGSQRVTTALAAALLASGVAPLCRAVAIPVGREAAIVACCLTTALVGLAVVAPGRLQPRAVVALALGAAIVAGMSLGATTEPTRASMALLGLMTVVPAAIAEQRGLGIARRVVASWLIAVAVLAAVLPVVIAHPGYIPDHRG